MSRKYLLAQVEYHIASFVEMCFAVVWNQNWDHAFTSIDPNPFEVSETNTKNEVASTPT